MQDNLLTIDNKDINVLNSVGALYIMHSNPFFARDLLALSYELDAANDQTLRLLCIANVKCGNPEAAHAILERQKLAHGLSFTQTFLHKFAMLKTSYISKAVTQKAGVL